MKSIYSFAVNYFNLSYSYVTLYMWLICCCEKTVLYGKQEFRIHDFLVQFLHNKMQSEFHFQNKLSQIFINDFQFAKIFCILCVFYYIQRFYLHLKAKGKFVDFNKTIVFRITTTIESAIY